MENAFSCIQAIIVYITYATVIRNSSIKKRLLVALLIVIVVSIFTFKKDEISTITNTLIRVYLIFSVLYFFVYLLEELKVENLFLYGFFWVSAGILIYATGTLFTYLFSEYVFSPNTSDEAFELYWNITQLTSILFTLLASLGIFVSKFENTAIA
ncbi:hypothetical protein WBJ53_29585 [Spirosoma sp. SC4-14]|uniref:hypothetical protein n=1 Tax=Spirosoma sp. SC4-14 TaxID=3128900 RepID=UPI0030CCDDB5